MVSPDYLYGGVVIMVSPDYLYGVCGCNGVPRLYGGMAAMVSPDYAYGGVVITVSPDWVGLGG